MTRTLADEEGKHPGAAIWEGINPITNKWSINVERVLPWVNGRRADLHIATDISHLKKLQDEREKMEAQLNRAQKMEAIGCMKEKKPYTIETVGLAINNELNK